MSWVSSFRSLFFYPQPKQYNIYRAFTKTLDLHKDTIENPYFEKYADKIAKLQKTSPEDFKVLLKKNLEAIEEDSCSINKDIIKEHKYKKNIEIPHLQKQKDLNQVMKLDAVQEKSAEEIESIWKQYHQVKDGVYAVLPGDSFEKMHSNLKKYPVFLFPLPRVEGYEFIMCQFLEKSCYFTSLLNYQAFKENAPVCLTVTYFTELKEEKGIVLMRGEYDDTALKAHEAQCLTNQLHLYYGSSNKEKLQQVHKFNNQPESFRHMDLISNFESSLGK